MRTSVMNKLVEQLSLCERVKRDESSLPESGRESSAEEQLRRSDLAAPEEQLQHSGLAAPEEQTASSVASVTSHAKVASKSNFTRDHTAVTASLPARPTGADKTEESVLKHSPASTPDFGSSLTEHSPASDSTRTKLQNTILDVEVCIIGAGISGIRTAHALIAGGVPSQSIVVLEAQNRLGGRIHTDRARSKLGAAYDLGAAWFHDLLTNNVIDHLRETGAWQDADAVFDDGDPEYYAQEAEGPLDVAGLRLNRVVEEMERWIDIMFRDLLDAPDMSLAQAAQRYVATRSNMLTAPQKQYCARMVRALELWHGALHEVISARHAFLDYDGRHLFNRAGYDRLVLQLAEGVRVELGEAVHLIERDKNATLAPHTNRRHVVHSTHRTVSADYVVVAVPHSILALAPDHPHALRWDPPLPRAMADLFGALHFDALGKVILEFSAVWWPDRDLFEVMADCPDGAAFLDEPAPFQYPISISNYARHGVPALVVQVQSPVTEYLESAPARAWPFLKPMVCKIGRGNVPDPINVIVTDWTLNPYIRGSYNTVHVGDDPYDLLLHVSGENTSCGLGPLTVRFAGDHTVGDGNGCVHGAFDSGARAAAWILDHRADRPE